MYVLFNSFEILRILKASVSNLKETVASQQDGINAKLHTTRFNGGELNMNGSHAEDLCTIEVVDSCIKPHSIKECFRLRKFSSNVKCPKPILISFIRIVNVSAILSIRSKLAHPYYIKADMSHEEWKRE